MVKSNKKLILMSILELVLFANCTEYFDNRHKVHNTTESEKIVYSLGNKEKELVFNFEKIETTNKKRFFKKINLNSLFKMGGIENEQFLFPSRIIIDNEKNIFILDNIDCSVSKFDKKGRFIKKYGRNGKGPGEFENAFAFDVFEDEKVAIISPNDNKFTVFDNDKIYEYKCRHMPSRLRFLSSYEIVTFQFMDPVNSSQIQKVNYVDQISKEYQNLFNLKSFKNQDVGMLPFLLGDLHKYGNNKIIYISEILGYVVLFNEDGQIEFGFTLIDNIKVEGLVKKEEKVSGLDLPIVRFPKIQEYLFLDSNIYEDKLFVLSEAYQYIITD